MPPTPYEDLLSSQPLEFLPLWAMYILSVLVLLLAYQGGLALGTVWERRRPDKAEGSVGALSGATLALLGFLLAFVVNAGVNNFTARREAVLNEANAIGTTWLRAGYLPDPYAAESRQLLREYVDQRVAAVDPTQTAQAIARSEEIQQELWTRAESLAKTSPSPTLALYIAALNEVIDLHTVRINVALVFRLPWALVLVLVVIAILAMGLVGLHAAYTEKRNPLALLAFVLTLAVVFLLIVDLSRGQEGMLKVSQQALLDLQRQLNQP
jgi:hypothetical protein